MVSIFGRAARLLLPAIVVAATPSFAEPLSGDGIRQAIAGKTVYLKTPYGLEMPLRYRANGNVSGDVSGFRLARMFAPKETGRWWVDGARLCQKWPTWYDGKQFCFTVSMTGERTINWVRDDGYSGTARIEG